MAWFWRVGLGLCLFLPACGGDSTSDGGGAGSGGSAGVGSGGSAGANECLPLLDTKPPHVGFLPEAPAGSFTITAVTPTSIQFADATFDWNGPDLTQRFTAGEAVESSGYVAGGWNYVAGASYTAEAFDLRGMFMMYKDMVPELPYYGPKLTYVVQCSFPRSSEHDCGTSTVYAVEATTGGAPLVIAVGETSNLVGWDITNVGNGLLPSGSLEDIYFCSMEPEFGGAITAIGPALDPGSDAGG